MPSSFLFQQPKDNTSPVNFARSGLLLSLCCFLSACEPQVVNPLLQTKPEKAQAQISKPKKQLPRKHKVRKGDTLTNIAKRYGLNRQDLADWNAIKPPKYIVRLGQKLRLHAPSPFKQVEKPKTKPSTSSAKKNPTVIPEPSTPIDDNSPLLSVEKKPQVARQLNTEVAESLRSTDEGEFIAYKPPVKGVTERVPVQSRGQSCLGLSRQALNLQLWAPQHIAWTHRSQPQLYWSLEQPIEAYVNVTITEISPNPWQAPIIEKQRRQRLQPGAYVFNLASEQIRLQANKVYQWSVSLSCQRGQTPDTMASAEIQYMPLMQAAPANAAQQAAFYARQGYWYDALESLQGQQSQQAQLGIQKLLQQGRVSLRVQR